jgi:hypothetical protein
MKTSDRVTPTRGRDGGWCGALLSVRTLSISYAEGFLVISCVKVSYDKSS